MWDPVRACVRVRSRDGGPERTAGYRGRSRHLFKGEPGPVTFSGGRGLGLHKDQGPRTPSVAGEGLSGGGRGIRQTSMGPVIYQPPPAPRIPGTA